MPGNQSNQYRMYRRESVDVCISLSSIIYINCGNVVLLFLLGASWLVIIWVFALWVLLLQGHKASCEGPASWRFSRLKLSLVAKFRGAKPPQMAQVSPSSWSLKCLIHPHPSLSRVTGGTWVNMAKAIGR